MKRLGILLILVLPLTACTGPSEWALSLEKDLECGMTVSEVEAMAGRSVRADDYGPDWQTHYISGEDWYYDDVYLGFVDGKLRYFQIRWGVAMSTRVKELPRVDLCPPERK